MEDQAFFGAVVGETVQIRTSQGREFALYKQEKAEGYDEGWRCGCFYSGTGLRYN